MKWIKSWIATIAILLNRPLIKRLRKAEEECKRGETIPWEMNKR